MSMDIDQSKRGGHQSNHKTSKGYTELVDCMDRIVSKSEIMLRGGMSRMPEDEVESVKTDAYYLYDSFHNSTYLAEQLSSIQEDKKRALLELSIKLHNKIRNLPSNLIETRAVLKASCAWAFATLSEKHDKVSVIVIKLLRKAGEELSYIHVIDKALDCFSVAANLWKTVQNASYIDQLPPLEVQDLKLAIFSCHLQILKLLSLDGNTNMDIREHLQAAMELLPYVSIKNRFSLAELLADIASKLSTKKEFHSSSINLFDKCIEILDSKELKRDNMTTHDAETKWKHASTIKLRCYLSMAYMLLMEEDRTKAWAALGCVDNLQKSADLQLNHSTCYAKVILLIKDKQFDKAEEHVKTLMKMSSTPFKTVLSAVNHFFNNLTDTNIFDMPAKITEIYKLFASRSLSDEETTSVRISHLQTILKNLMNKPDNELLEERARQLMIRLFSAVAQGEMKLSAKDNEHIGNLIKEQIKAFRTKGSWSKVRHWCDILLPFLDSSPDNEARFITCAIFKVEALLKLNQNAEAQDTAFKAITKQITNQTILIYFQTMLTVDDISEEEVVRRFQLQQDKATKTKELQTDDAFLEDKYGQIMLCLSYTNSRHADNIPLKRKNLATIYLIKYLLNYVHQHKLWNEFDETTFKTPLFHLARSYLGQYISITLNVDNLLQNSLDENASSINLDQSTIFSSIEDDESKVMVFRNFIISLCETMISILEEVANSHQREKKVAIFGPIEVFLEVNEIIATLGYILAVTSKRNKSDTMKKKFLFVSGDILVAAGSLYHFVPLFTDTPYKQQEARCIITAASALLDGVALIAPAHSDFEDFINAGQDQRINDDNSEFYQVHTTVQSLAQQAQTLLYNQLEYDDPTDRKLFSLAVLMEISSFCRSGKIGQSEGFVNRILQHVSVLDMEDMKSCIDLFALSQNVSTEAFRMLLNIAARMCLQTVPVHKATGYVFAKELQLSSSRAAALQKVEQFAKLLENPANTMMICTDDIDYITANAHNAAMSLHELGQEEMATKFNGIAMILVTHAAKERRQDWLDRMKALEKAIAKQEEELSSVIVSAAPDIELGDDNSSTENARKRQKLEDTAPKTPDRVGPLRVEDFVEPSASRT